MAREHSDAIGIQISNTNEMGVSYAARVGALEEDLRIAVTQGLNALAEVKKIEVRVDKLLGSNSVEVENRREAQRDALVQETIVAALADRCIIVEAKLKRS